MLYIDIYAGEQRNSIEMMKSIDICLLNYKYVES